MTANKTGEPKPLRLWPGVVAVTLQWLLRFVLPRLWPDGLEYEILGAVAMGLLIVLWWLFFSRAPWLDRLIALPLIVVSLLATKRILDPSVATGMMGFMLYIFAVPVVCLAFVLWAVATRRLSIGLRRATMVATILLACTAFTLLRTNGINGDAKSDFAWRWAPTAEDRLVHAAGNPAPEPVKIPDPPRPTAAAKIVVEPVAAPSIPKNAKIVDWPGFRGPNRNDILPGVQIETDWVTSPPLKMWKHAVGPGWSSFAVHGDFFYTQEQRGNDELVSSYQVSTGELIWKHTDATRFWESNAGPGPRGTPTLSNGRVYAFGATGILNALDARTGAVIWSRNAGTDTGIKVPEWGFASSPVVVDNLVIIAACGKLAAYDLATGEPRWYGPDGHYGYSSPQLLTIDGVPQIVLMSKPGATSVAVADGTKLWEAALPDAARITQPNLTEDGDLLLAEGEGHNLHRVAVTHGPNGWTTEERWTSNGLKPYFSDLVIHKGHAYGFDGAILSCIDLKDGKRKWKGGRYGAGQVLLLSDQNVLLVLGEEGDIAVASAVPDQFNELAKIPAIEGKTWNHPVLAGDVLLVRNGQEMAAFRLAQAHP